MASGSEVNSLCDCKCTPCRNGTHVYCNFYCKEALRRRSPSRVEELEAALEAARTAWRKFASECRENLDQAQRIASPVALITIEAARRRLQEMDAVINEGELPPHNLMQQFLESGLAVEQQLQRALEAEQRVEHLECVVDGLSTAMKQYAPFRNCDSIRDVFNVYDSMEGRALAAEERLQPFLDAVKREGDHLDADGLIRAFIAEQERLRDQVELEQRLARKCSVCADPTPMACSDCAIDLHTTVYVCSKSECRKAHDTVCPFVLRARLRSKEFTE